MTKHTIPEICGSTTTSCKAPAPVAKPIVWEDFTDSDGSHELGAEIGANMRFRITSQCNDKVKQLLLIKYYNDYSVLDDHMFIGNFEEVEAAKQFAQDWLNKLVADMSIASTCPENVSKNGEDLKVSDSTGLNPSNSRGLKTNCTEESDSSTPQFTAEEINGIRKVAQFCGLTIANSIIAKCDAMLKGGCRNEISERKD